MKRVRGRIGVAAAGVLAGLALGPTAIASADDSIDGEALYRRFECEGCHEVAAFPGMVVVPLDGLAQRFTADALAAWLASPKEPMPLIEMTDAERRALAAHLLQRFP